MITTTFAERLFDGKTALITGAAGGIGAGIARCFAGLGAKVLLQDKDREGLARMAAELAGARGGIATLGGDLSEPGVAESVFDRALIAAGRVDFLVTMRGSPRRRRRWRSLNPRPSR